MRRLRLGIWAVALGLAVQALLPCSAAADAFKQPARIVSLNLCTDQLLVDLVPASRIAALSRLAADTKLSAVADRVQHMRRVGGAAEEVLALDPDLIVTSEHAAPTTVALLRRLGRTVVAVPFAQDFDGFRGNVRALAAAVGEQERGERMIADFDTRLAAVAAEGHAQAKRPTALSWEVNRLSAGVATLLDAEMRAAGLVNAARSLSLGPAAVLPLETIVAQPPDVLVLANAPDDYRTTAADNLRHPALTRAMSGREMVRVPMPLWLCASPRSLEAIELLAAARVRVAAKAVEP